MNSAIADFWWVNDQRVVVAMAAQLGSLEAPQQTGDLHGVNADGCAARIVQRVIHIEFAAKHRGRVRFGQAIEAVVGRIPRAETYEGAVIRPRGIRRTDCDATMHRFLRVPVYFAR